MVYALAVHPDTPQFVLASGLAADPTTNTKAGISLSNDGGQTWTAFAAPPGTLAGHCLMLDPTVANSLLVGTLGGGVYRVTWDGDPAFALHAEASVGGSVAKSVNRTYFSPGAEVAVTATPAPGYSLLGWDIDGAVLASTADPLQVVMNASHLVRARFHAWPVAVTVNAGPGGTATRQPDLTAYDLGSTVTLTARPDAAHVFSRWVGDVPPGRSLANPLVLTVDTTRTLTAQFGAEASSWLMVR